MDLAAEGYKTVSHLLLATLITDALPPRSPNTRLAAKSKAPLGLAVTRAKLLAEEEEGKRWSTSAPRRGQQPPSKRAVR